MIDATTEELQKIWDELLIECWKHHCDCGNLVRRFADATGVPDPSMDEWTAVLETFPLKRTCTFQGDGSVNFKMPIRAFIENRCPVLSNLLWGGKDTTAEVVEVIDAFKFRARLRDIKKSRYNKAQGRVHYKQTRRIHAREIINKHDWGTHK
jgi:hypothetical protein